MSDTRPCPQCGTLVSLTPGRVKRGNYMCQPCVNLAVRRWSLANPKRALELANKRARAYQQRHPEKLPTKSEKKAYDREWTLRRQYGIGVADYNALLVAQEGCCAICRTDKMGGKGVFHVDHEHTTLTVRGLLCTSCNTGIGSLKESVAILQRAIDYLSRCAEEKVA